MILKSWNNEQSDKFVEKVKAIITDLSEKAEKLVRKFSYTCCGNFAPLCSFFGGLVSQEVFKSITGKYMPINQYFFIAFD